MIRSDNHVHTSFSTDSDTPMEAMVRRGIKLGLDSICFTDHIDYDFPDTGNGVEFLFEMEPYFEMLSCFAGKISAVWDPPGRGAWTQTGSGQTVQ